MASLTDQINELLAQLTPEVRQAFQDAMADVVDNAILQQVVEALEANDLAAAWAALGYSEAVFNPFIVALRTVFESAGTLVMSSFPKYVTDSVTGFRAVLRFNVRDQRAEKWLAEQSSRLITGIEEDMRNAVRTTLETGMAEGRNPRNVALDIVGKINPITGKREGGVLGLGAREEAWQRTARLRLLASNEAERIKYFEMELRDKRFDPTVAKAIQEQKPLPADVVDKLVDRYRVNALKYRGETIGRTEALQALNQSEYLATKQAVEAGRITASAVQREWDSAGDNRVRPSHRALNGQIVGLDEPFVSPLTGARMMHPGDMSLGAPAEDVIMCRCRVKTRVDWFKGVK